MPTDIAAFRRGAIILALGLVSFGLTGLASAQKPAKQPARNEGQPVHRPENRAQPTRDRRGRHRGWTQIRPTGQFSARRRIRRQGKPGDSGNLPQNAPTARITRRSLSF